MGSPRPRSQGSIPQDPMTPPLGSKGGGQLLINECLDWDGCLGNSIIQSIAPRLDLAKSFNLL